MEFLTALVPLWAMLVLIALAGAAGWFWGRSAVAEVRQRAEAAEREAQWATDRAGAAQQAADAVIGALAEQLAVAGSDLPPRDGTVDVTAIAVDYPPLDDAFDVYGSDDLAEPDAAPADESTDPPAGAGAEPAEVFHAAILPRYDWSHTGWDPRGAWATPVARPSQQLLPWGRGLDLLRRVSRWPVAPVRWARWTLAGWSWRAAARAEAREAAEAARLLGYDPEPTGALPCGRPSVQPVVPPVPPAHRPVHVWRRKAISVAAVLGGHLPDRPAGRHRFGVAVGALAQRQGRLLALPAGAP